ncbi:hypothetical protein FVE85_0860 [Porphyridium purpureum]|uniref:Uncharacterized protein n=1 Tax=Porphyridium purpureum TaxID=35688 RepID=A0A5J4YZS2_PORPP|nr:hypothetical protein FVE85_0860 [Porphyridium purpureum]|eukprot:POR1561..scf208_2
MAGGREAARTGRLDMAMPPPDDQWLQKEHGSPAIMHTRCEGSKRPQKAHTAECHRNMGGFETDLVRCRTRKRDTGSGVSSTCFVVGVLVLALCVGLNSGRAGVEAKADSSPWDLRPSEAVLDAYSSQILSVYRSMQEEQRQKQQPEQQSASRQARRRSPTPSQKDVLSSAVLRDLDFVSRRVKREDASRAALTENQNRSAIMTGMRRSHFGQAVCASADGSTVVVGANAFLKTQGSVFVFEFDESDRNSQNRRSVFRSAMQDQPVAWTETLLTFDETGMGTQYLASLEHATQGRGPPPATSAGRAGLGFACAMSADGTALAVSSPSGGTTSSSGAAIPPPSSTSAASNFNDGYVVFFHKEASPQPGQRARWVQAPERLHSTMPLSESDRRSNAFGWALSGSADGTLLAVSARGTRAHNGAVEVFKCERGFRSCVFVQGLEPPEEVTFVGPRGIRIRNNFGMSLALSGDGSTLVVGNTGYDYEQGCVYVYEIAKGHENRDVVFELAAQLVSAGPQKYGYFGYKVAVDDVGLTVAAGADGEDEYRGAAYTFRRSRARAPWSKPSVLLIPEPERLEEDNFGGSVALSGDGTVLAVGAPGAKKNRESDHGALYVYELLESTWELSMTVRRPEAQGMSGDLFAWALCLDRRGRRVFIGSPEVEASRGLLTITSFIKSGRKNPTTDSLLNDDIINYYATKRDPELDAKSEL